MKRVGLLAVLILLVFGGSGCLKQDGGLTIQISSKGIETQTLVPEIDLTITTYDIIGQGPNGESFTVYEITDTSFTQTQLAFGEWIVTVYAKNIIGTVIGEGTESVIVHVGETSNVNITVKPLVGVGNLDLTVKWKSEDTESPSITSQLIPPLGSSTDLNFTINGGDTGTYALSDLATGYYSLIVQLMDNGILTMGTVEVVRIVKDQTTTGVFEFYNINEPGGNIIVGITPEMDDPIVVTLLNKPGVILSSDLVDVSAMVPNDVGNVVYVWYLNGQAVAVGPTYTVQSLDDGVYQLDVTVFTIDGKRGGSAGCTFTVVDPQKISDGWAKAYGTYYWEEAYGLTPIATGGYAVSGFRDSGGDYEDILAYKIDENGSLLWSKWISTPNDEICYSIKETLDGSLLLGGYVNTDGLLVKLDDSGNLLWSKSWRASEPVKFHNVEMASDGDYLAVGRELTDGGTSSDVLILKTDQSGITRWAWSGDTTEGADLYTIDITSDDGFVAGGLLSTNNTNFDGLVMKFDKYGNKQWSVALDSGYDDLLSDVFQLDDGGYILLGSIRESGLLTDCFVVKLDSTGTIDWVKTYQGEYSGILAKSITQVSDGYMICGNTAMPGSHQSVLLKVDLSGNLLWAGTFYGETESFESLNTIVSSDIGGIVSTGLTSTEQGGVDTFVLRIKDILQVPNWDHFIEMNATQGMRSFTVTDPTFFWTYMIDQTADLSVTILDDNLNSSLLDY